MNKKMDRRDRMASRGTFLDNLPDVKIDIDKMTATFSVDDGEGDCGCVHCMGNNANLCEGKKEDLREMPVHELHLEWQLCGTCEGKGKHVNPSIDAHGISSEEFEEDPDFREDYFSGTYDVECYECHGRTTSLSVNEEDTKSEALDAMFEILNDQDDYDAEREAERRMGY